MSLRAEQYRALRTTRDFLRDLLDPKAATKTRTEIKERAYLCLRHFPHLKKSGEPIFSRDCFPIPEDED